MRFTKMHGLGNDFVVIEGSDPDPDTIRALCDRRRGVGADGVLAVDDLPSMRYWNADGSAAEMCGNGLRCVARHAVDRGWASAGEWFEMMTPMGRRRALVGAEEVTVEVGRITVGATVDIGGRSYQTVDIGNPHAVTLVGDPDDVDVAAVGRGVGTDPVFPHGTNVEFVSRQSEAAIRMRVWERGVGETPACGSGMVAAVGAVVGTESDGVVVEVPGGVARVSFEDGSGYLTAPAVSVFAGEWLLSGVDAAR